MLLIVSLILTNTLLVQALCCFAGLLVLVRRERRRRHALGLACYPLDVFVPRVPVLATEQAVSAYVTQANHEARMEWLYVEGLRMLAEGYSVQETLIRLSHVRASWCPYFEEHWPMIA